MNLFNTMSGQIEPLAPSNGPLRLYCCGPTVYDYGHIGNFRTFLHVDIARRVLLQRGIAIKHVMNITDVDDKIIRNAAAANLPIGEFTKKYENAFFEDMTSLGIQMPEHIARATEHIDEMVSLIQTLAEKDIAYRTEDGSWYFRIAKFPDYGKLSKKDFEGIEDGARVDVDEYEKDAARDFALWKAPKPGEHHWDTPLGPGRPGWHIECSAMAMSYLGASFDLHAGGEDLMFPHHENEIAQSECAGDVPFARHWMHVRFLLVEGKKMSKSEGNFYTLRDLLLKGHKAAAIRFLLISVPYRKQLNFTFEGLLTATNAVERLRTFKKRVEQVASSAIMPAGASDGELLAAIDKAHHDYTAALADDLNTAEASAAIFEVVRIGNAASDAGTLTPAVAAKMVELLQHFDGVFEVLNDRDEEITRAAIEWAKAEGRGGDVSSDLENKYSLSDADIDTLVAERTQAKKTRNFARADAIRNDLLAKGILIEDSKDGVSWKRK